MAKQKSTITIAVAAICLVVLILDSKTAFTGAYDGLQFCLQVVIPSLFPYYLISITLVSLLSCKKGAILRPFGKVLRIPKGAEIIYILGLLGGYPVGAQSIVSAYKQGMINKRNAERMLAFCNNAGPAFIFGFGSTLFIHPCNCWVVWFIHVISSVLVATITPAEPLSIASSFKCNTYSLTDAFQQALRTMASVCGWVILFRTTTAILERWLFCITAPDIEMFISGLLELSYGSSQLRAYSSEIQKMTYFTTLLSFGGFCVAMQTYTVFSSANLSFQYYFPGKFLQAAISYLICIMLFSHDTQNFYGIFSLFSFGLVCIIYLRYYNKNKNTSRNIHRNSI